MSTPRNKFKIPLVLAAAAIAASAAAYVGYRMLTAEAPEQAPSTAFNQGSVTGTVAILQDVWGDMIRNDTSHRLGLTADQKREVVDAFSYTNRIDAAAQSFLNGQDYKARIDLKDGSFVGVGVFAEHGHEEVLAIRCHPVAGENRSTCGQDVGEPIAGMQVNMLRSYRALNIMHRQELDARAAAKKAPSPQ